MKTTPADTARSVGKELGIEGFQESEEKYQMLLDGIRAYAIFMMDPHGRIISWNNGAERIKGYTAVLKQTRKI
jgi:PAS domain-containing protein